MTVVRRPEGGPELEELESSIGHDEADEAMDETSEYVLIRSFDGFRFRPNKTVTDTVQIPWVINQTFSTMWNSDFPRFGT